MLVCECAWVCVWHELMRVCVCVCVYVSLWLCWGVCMGMSEFVCECMYICMCMRVCVCCYVRFKKIFAQKVKILFFAQIYLPNFRRQECRLTNVFSIQ